jgi:hypothetical protein
LLAVGSLAFSALFFVGAQSPARGDAFTADRSPCTWFVSPKGSVRSGGRLATRPTTLRFAAERVAPGDVVCLLSGTYRLGGPLKLRRAGTERSWIVFRQYRGRALIVPRAPMAHALIEVYAPAAYLQFNGLSFDGGGTGAYEAIMFKQGVHHVRVTGSRISNMGAAGIATTSADYVSFIGNRIYRFGDGVGWSSGISFNSTFGAFKYDNAPGFHNVIAKNVIAGGVDNSGHHSDGNGIIVDLGGDIAPVLVANNVAYMNGGRCIENLQVSHVWVVNNTCYMNGLDSRLGQVGEIQNQQVQDVHLINNVAVAWTDRYPYKSENSSGVTFSHNLAFGGLASIVPDEVRSDPAALRTINPMFFSPPRVDLSADGQWTRAPAVSGVGTYFRPGQGSPLRMAGTDPRGEPGVTPEYRQAFDLLLARDLAGTLRCGCGRYGVGAYGY